MYCNFAPPPKFNFTFIYPTAKFAYFHCQLYGGKRI